MMYSLLNVLLMAPPADGSKGSGYMSFIFLIMIGLVFYLFFIRPQAKKTKEQKKFREALKEGDKVVTIGGLHGRIVKVMDHTFLLEVSDNVRIKIERSAVAMPDQEPSVDNK